MPSPFSIGALVGDYRLTGRIGSGGMGEVFLAEHIASGQPAAVKVFAQSVNAQDLARFYQEARIHQSLVHANIAECRELVTTAGTPCLVMEWVDGPSVAELIAARGRLDAAEALAILAAVAAAVAHAHAHGVVHRDIKPANVRLTRHGRVKLLDFGIAKRAGVRGLTAAGAVIGTPQYLSPEQLVGGPVTPASDVWALGVMLFEMLTGAPPFAGDTPQALWTAITSARPPALEDQPRAVDRILRTCLVVDRSARRASAFDVAAMASAGDTGEGPAVIGRRRAVVGAAVAAGVLVLAAAAYAFWPSAAIPEDERGVHVIDANRPSIVFVNGARAGRTPLTYHGRIGTSIAVRVEPDDRTDAAQSADIQITSSGTTTFTFQRERGEP